MYAMSGGHNQIGHETHVSIFFGIFFWPDPTSYTQFTRMSDKC